MAVKTYGWCRVEGTPIIDKRQLYGDFTNLPPNVDIFYGQPEVQIFNKNTNPVLALTDGIVYRQIFIEDLEHGNQFETIQEIDASYNLLLSDINNINKRISTLNDDIYYHEPFAVTKSSVIFYAGSSELNYNKYIIIYVDTINTPKIIAITSKYNGSPIPIDDSFSLDNLEVNAIYEDGNKAIIKQGYSLTPSNRVVTVVGSNPFEVSYITPNGKNLTSGFIVQGIKALVGVSVTYDGPTLAFTQEAEIKYFLVIATYSDGSSATVTDYTFPEGRVVSQTNNGVLRIYYKGFYATVTVPTYDVTNSRLIAWYNGPNVEINNEWQLQYAKVKIYYQGSNSINSYYEEIDNSNCEFDTMMITHEGINQILVTYVGKLGPVTAYMAINGFKPDVVLNFITAEYTGPNIVINKTFSPERVIVKAHYSNGEIIQVKGFTISTTTVTEIGLNTFDVSFSDTDGNVGHTTFQVLGLPADSTTKDSYYPITLDNNYPEATKYNNRYRGPAEANKHDKYAYMINLNIRYLYSIFENLENNFNNLINKINNDSNNKYESLSRINEIETTKDKWINDERFI